jgi:hypothetical protein
VYVTTNHTEFLRIISLTVHAATDSTSPPGVPRINAVSPVTAGIIGIPTRTLVLSPYVDNERASVTFVWPLSKSILARKTASRFLHVTLPQFLINKLDLLVLVDLVRGDHVLWHCRLPLRATKLTSILLFNK